MGWFKKATKKLTSSVKKAVHNPTHSGLVKGITSFGDGTGGTVTHYFDKIRRKNGLRGGEIKDLLAPTNSASSAANQYSYQSVNYTDPKRKTLSQMTGGV